MKINRKIWFPLLLTAACCNLPAIAQKSEADKRMEENMKNAKEVSDRNAKEAEAKRVREYNSNNDRANGISQRTGPTGSVGKGEIKGGYQKSIP